RLVFDELGDGEAIMRLDEGEIVESEPARREGLAPGGGAALEFQDVALRHGQEILRMGARPEGDGAAHGERGPDIRDDESGRAVRDKRAIGALQRARDERILLALGAAEIVAEILAQLRIRIVDAVLVVLRRDEGERVRLVAVALEIAARDLPEDAS